MRENNLIKELKADSRSYIESAGKFDKQTVVEALEDGGESTVLRMGIGVSTDGVPLRSMSYIASALATRDLYFPKAQLQLVYPIFAAQTVNRVPVAIGLDRAIQISDTAMYLFDDHQSVDYQDKVTSLTDSPTPEDGLDDEVANFLATEEELSGKLSAAAARRLGGAASYVAAHLRVHDTAGKFELLDDSLCNVPASAERVISIGGQSERLFYGARMMCRAAGVLPAEADVQTGQLFTKHVLPPYLPSQQGEPALPRLEDLAWSIFQTSKIPTVNGVASVARDLNYLKSELEHRDTVSFHFGW